VTARVGVSDGAHTRLQDDYVRALAGCRQNDGATGRLPLSEDTQVDVACARKDQWVSGGLAPRSPQTCVAAAQPQSGVGCPSGPLGLTQPVSHTITADVLAGSVAWP
jgi:hypothetical protein